MTQQTGFLQRLNRRMLGKLVLIAFLMFGFGYALIPIYRKICEITGVNLITPQDMTVKRPDNTQVDKSRKVTIEFDATAQGPWRARPVKNSLDVHPGELAHIVYEVVNKEKHPVTAQAIPSYAPQQSGEFFKKVECFCFQQQKLGPNEARQMQVVFYVDPKLPANVKTITVSYTFFEVAGLNKPA
ncbi:cytochrome c oxidase assembly protein [Massilia sp. W12]|uniref:cytochrome c oxidase assembly protein n=1 Tax=Massilia sp. W12 TaxID=3126507 RepID=UPI0030D49E38